VGWKKDSSLKDKGKGGNSPPQRGNQNGFLPAEVKKMGWKELLYKEPLEPRIKPEEFTLLLLEDPEKKKIVLEDYDVCQRKAARIYFETAIHNYRVCYVLGRIWALHQRKKNWPLPEEVAHSIWEDHFFDLVKFLYYVMGKEAPEQEKEIGSLKLSIIQMGWAVQAAVYTLAEEGYLDERGCPKNELFKEKT
jgi:hypothetical protein